MPRRGRPAGIGRYKQFPVQDQLNVVANDESDEYDSKWPR